MAEAAAETRTILDHLKSRTPEQLAKRTMEQKWVELAHHHRTKAQRLPVGESTSLLGSGRYNYLAHDPALADLAKHGDPAQKPLTRMWLLPARQWGAYLGEHGSWANFKDLAYRAAVRYNQNFVQTGAGSPMFGRAAPFYHLFVGWVTTGVIVFAWPKEKAHRKYDYH